MEVGILTLNVEGYRRFYNKRLGGNLSNLSILDKLIDSVNPEVLLLQEDILPSETNQYPKGWKRISCCRSHVSSMKYIYLMNSILVRPENEHHITYANEEDLYNTNFIMPKRCSSTIKYKGIIISNVHLSGGRFEDELYSENLTLRDEQLYKSSILLKSDIVAGDFNSNPDPMCFPETHPTYVKLTDLQKQVFKTYFASGHKPLLDANFIPVLVKEKTDMYGGNPDFIYYNPDNLRLIKSQIIDCLSHKTKIGTPLLTDHNGIYALFEIKNL